MTDRGHEVVRGLAAMLALIAGLAGVPAGLVGLGQGVPTALPSAHAMSSWFGHPVTDSSLLRAVTLACWAVWLLFAAAVAVEVAARISTRGRRRVAIPGLQGVAGALMMGALLLVPQRPMSIDATRPLGARLAAASGPQPAAVVAPPADVPVAVPVAVAEEPVPAGPVRYVVQRYDSPWRIAERRLGDGTRWREILDQQGRSLVRPVREGLPPRARIIYPGEVLLLPAEAADGAEPVVAPCPAPAPAVGPVAPAAAPDPPAPAPLEPGPSTPAPAPAPPVMHAVPDGAMGTAPAHPVLNITADHHRSGGALANVTRPLLEAGLLSAAVLGTVRGLRRRQARHRPPGRRIAMPGGDLAPIERALRLSEQPGLVDLIDRAMAVLAVHVAEAGGDVPTVVGVVAAPESVEVLLDRPATPAAPWVSSAEGFRWRLPAELIPKLDGRVSAPLPALIPIGKAAGSEAEVLLNLEAAGMLAVAGDPIRAAALAHAAAVGLACAPWAGAASVTLVDFPTDLSGIERIRHAACLGDVLPELRGTAKVMADVFAEQGCADPFAGRVSGKAPDGWPPAIVVCRHRPGRDELADLIELARPGTGVVAVVADPAGTAPWTLDVDADPMPVHPLRLAVDPTLLTDELLGRLGDLVRISDDERGGTLDDPPYDRIALTVERDDSGPADPPVLVRVLGTVEVENAAEFKRPKSKELLVYLAMHPNGVGEAELDEAMWPSDGARVVQASTRDSTVSVARTAVGGPGRLLPAQVQGREKRYQVSVEVGSDWALFCRLHRRARDTADVTLLRQALELVRGRPFDGVIAGRTYGWVHSEGHARHIEAEVGDAADLAAELYLGQGDAHGARWAARRGLTADPFSERLWVRLMEAADRLGESQEVERIMDEMDVVLELGGDFSMLHPNTLAAYQRFSRRDSGFRKRPDRVDSGRR